MSMLPLLQAADNEVEVVVAIPWELWLPVGIIAVLVVLALATGRR